MLPRLSYYVEERRTIEFNQLIGKTVNFIAFLAFPLTFFFVIESSDSVMLLAGENYNPSIIGMQILMPILLISGFSNILGNQILLPQGRDRCFMKAVITGAIIDAILNLFLLPKYGFIGAAVATLIAEIGQMSVQLFYSWKDIHKCINKNELIKIILSTLAATIVLLFMKNFIVFTPVCNLFILSIIFGVTYILIQVILKGETVKDLLFSVENLKIRKK